MSQKRDPSQAAEVHVVYEIAAERKIDAHDLHGEPCNDGLRGTFHSRNDVDAILAFLRGLGFQVEVYQKTSRLVETDFPEPKES